MIRIACGDGIDLFPVASNFSARKNQVKVESFYIFIFNKVKLEFKIILYQSNKVVFKVKVLTL